MTVEIKDYACVTKRTRELNCNLPDGIIILPENFDTAKNSAEFHLRSEAATIKSLFRQSEIPFGVIQNPGEQRQYIQNNASDLILPIMYVSASLISGNEQIISIALGVVSNYVTDFFKGRPGKHTVELNIVVEKTKSKSCKILNFKGETSDLASLPEIIKKLCDE